MREDERVERLDVFDRRERMRPKKDAQFGELCKR